MNLSSYLFRQSWPLVAVAIVAGLISGVSGAGLVAVISKAIATGGGSVLAGTFFLLCVVFLLSKSGAEIALLRLTQKSIYKMRIALSEKILAMPTKKLQEMGRPALFVVLTKDIDTFIQAFQLLPTAFGNFIIISVCLGYIAWLDWRVFLVFLLFLGISTILYSSVQKIPLLQLSNVREQMDALYKNFRSLIDGSRELQLNRKRGSFFVEEIIARGADDSMTSYVKGMKIYILIANSGTVMFYVVIGLMLFVMPTWIKSEPDVVTSVILTLLYLIRPISEIMSALPGLQQASIALGKIQRLDGELNATNVLKRGEETEWFDGSDVKLELCGICHQYSNSDDDRKFMLGPIDLQIRQGEILFIVGGNGSGKTTLAMLALGLYFPESGHIRLNGHTVTNENVHTYRQNFSAIFSDFHLFENLLDIGDQDLMRRAEYYIKLLQMERKVRIIDGRFSTTDLSSGQRKRLALVSSYLEDRMIYLFDEWASDQDPAFKHIFYTELLPELKARGKIVLVITHDDAYFSQADRVIKLQDGGVTEISIKDISARV